MTTDNSAFEATRALPIAHAVYENFVLPAIKMRLEDAKRKNCRFVQYTSADSALSILRNKCVWMRNASTMNDYSDVQYGLNCIHWLLNEREHALRTSTEQLFPGAWDELVSRVEGTSSEIWLDTYLASISEHDDTEDTTGRLSMWRAYGGSCGVALVVKPNVFFTETNVLHVYSQPVLYMNEQQLAEQFSQMAENFCTARTEIIAMGRERFLHLLFQVFRFAAICTKHVGFAEEREWRLVHAPRADPSKVVESEVVSVRGVPQRIYKVPLRDFPDDGFTGAAIPSLIDRIIVGPTQYPYVVCDAFVRELESCGGTGWLFACCCFQHSPADLGELARLSRTALL